MSQCYIQANLVKIYRLLQAVLQSVTLIPTPMPRPKPMPRESWTDPERGHGSGPPLENHKVSLGLL